ncbi:cytochrome c [Asaia sp. VD9]|uniref:c-type cytochrome n=1 Tax=Asaia sp. VD9 TaxID=3081235 RepID=UPI003016B1FA
MSRPALVLALLASLALSGCGKKSAGQKLYGPNCGICHHGGNGLPGEVPPLVGRLDLIAKTPAGRDYLARVMLNGLDGPIRANGSRYNFSMPSFRRLSDEQLSLILNWLIERGATKPAPHIGPEIFARARETEIGSNRVHDLREGLAAKGQIP